METLTEYEQGYQDAIRKVIWFIEGDIKFLEEMEQNHRQKGFSMRHFSKQREINKQKKAIEFIKDCFKRDFYFNYETGEIRLVSGKEIEQLTQ